jgi:XTP/dITP diphosphohydrolase
MRLFQVATEQQMNAQTRRIVVATGNKGKLAEIEELLQGSEFDIVPQADFGFESAAETGDTFLANALLKARHAASETGLIALADDSGLVVDALAGAPGVYSARYAGDGASDQQNIAKLLRALQDQDEQNRVAEFRCVAVVVFPDGRSAPLVAEGAWRGRIALSRHGQGGFGYDPVFFDPALGKCAAEMTAAEKNARSHRGQALRQLGELLREPGRLV